MNTHPTRYAIIGAGGFIGGAACRIALANGSQVQAIGPGDIPAHHALQHLPDQIDDMMPLAEALNGVDVVIHAAGRGTPSAVDRMDGEIATSEIRLAAQVMEAAAQAGVRKVVLVSSGGTVYGDAGDAEAITEDHALAPSSRYGAVKAMIEQMGLALTRAGMIECVVARVANPYGPGQRNVRGQGLVATLIESLLDGRAIPVWGDGSAVRDYIHVDDVARGLLAAAGMPGGSVYNISSGIGRSVKAVIADVSTALGRHAVIETMPWRDGGVQRSVLSHASLNRQAGWHPRVEWRDGLRGTVESWTGPGLALGGPAQSASHILT